MNKILHVYLGDGENHPIIGNYRRSCDWLGHHILLKGAPEGKLRRLISLFFQLIGKRSGRKEYSAVHTHDPISCMLSALILKRKTIFDCHEIYHSYFQRGLRRTLIRALERWCFRGADALVFPSEERVRYFNPPEEKPAFVIENLYMPYPGDKGADESDLPGVASLTVPPGRRVVYAGNLADVRGIGELVEAFHSSELAGYLLLVAGRSNRFWKEIEKTKPGNVLYLGPLSHEETLALFKTCSIGIALYKPINENNRMCAPTKIFEMTCHQLKVVANESSYLHSLQEEGLFANIELVAEINPEAIKESILQIADLQSVVSDADVERASWLSQIDRAVKLYSVVDSAPSEE